MYARVLDRCDDSHAAFAQVWELRQEEAGEVSLAAGPGPVRDAEQDLRRTLTELRRAVAHWLPLGPLAVAFVRRLPEAASRITPFGSCSEDQSQFVTQVRFTALPKRRWLWLWLWLANGMRWWWQGRG